MENTQKRSWGASRRRAHQLQRLEQNFEAELCSLVRPSVSSVDDFESCVQNEAEKILAQFRASRAPLPLSDDFLSRRSVETHESVDFLNWARINRVRLGNRARREKLALVYLSSLEASVLAETPLASNSNASVLASF